MIETMYYLLKITHFESIIGRFILKKKKRYKMILLFCTNESKTKVSC